jgi:exosome complex RNA-binding protein Csl4
MKNLILIIGFGLLSLIGLSQDCKELKSGNFKVDSENFTTYIERKDGFQIEKTPSIGLIVKTKIEWISECSYSLKVVKILENKNNMEFPTEFLESVTIFKVIEQTTKFYVGEASTTINGEKYIMKIKYLLVE